MTLENERPLNEVNSADPPASGQSYDSLPDPARARRTGTVATPFPASGRRERDVSIPFGASRAGIRVGARRSGALRAEVIFDSAHHAAREEVGGVCLRRVDDQGGCIGGQAAEPICQWIGARWLGVHARRPQNGEAPL